MSLFSFLKRKKDVPEENNKTTAELIMFEQLHEVEDALLTKLASNIINGRPLIVNFESLDVDTANKAIWFLSGVVYAAEGEVETISEKIFLFGNSEVYKDGSVEELLKNL